MCTGKRICFVRSVDILITSPVLVSTFDLSPDIPLYPFSSPISFVYFDLDDTLLDHRGAEKKALLELHQTVPELKLFETPEQLQSVYHTINTKVWVQYSDAEIDKATARVLRFSRLLREIDITDEALSSDLGQRYLDTYAEHWSWKTGARDAFVRIADRLDVGILTNGFAEVQRQKIEQFSELGHHASCTVIGEDTGFMKPDIRIFEFATQKAGVNAEEILYVGDSLRSDVRGGQNAGWNVAWLADNLGPTECDIAEATFATWDEFESDIAPHFVR